MDKKELKKQISEMSKKAEAKRKKREYMAIGAFAVVFVLLYCFLEKTPETFNEVVMVIIGSLALSALHCGINQAVFNYLFEKDELAHREISELRKQLSAIQEKEYDEMIKKLTKERDANVR